MANFGAKILNNAVSSLSAQQAVIATISNNIANVNTPGYVRRQAQLQTREGSNTGLSVGNGVEVSTIQRVADQYLEASMRGAAGSVAQESIKSDYLSQIESLYNLTGSQVTIGSALNDFFSALNQVALNPASLELRSNLLQRGQDLATIINTTYSTIADTQTELDQRLGQEIQTVNSLTSQIADLNQKVATREASGVTAADERDQRDVLLNKLAEKLTFTSVEDSNGSVSIFLDNGFALVNGPTARQLETTVNPTFVPGGSPPSLGGGSLSYVVFDYGSPGNPSQIDLTKYLKGGSGTIGGILQLRGYADPNNTSAFQADGELVAMASRVEALARTLLVDFNQTYVGADEDSLTAGHQASTGDLNGNSPNAFGLFDTTLYDSSILDNGDGYPTAADLDRPAIRPPNGVDNYASIIKFAVSRPEEFAAAQDLNTGAGGATTFQDGDARNAQALADLRSKTFTFARGSYLASNITVEDQYTESVTYVGNAKATSDSNLKVAQANYLNAANHRDEVSGVSLDEEFAGLIKYQKAYQASAKMIRVASDLLDQVVSLL